MSVHRPVTGAFRTVTFGTASSLNSRVDGRLAHIPTRGRTL